MRVLGLDIGSTSIKAIELDTSFGRFEIHEYHEVRIEPGSSAIDAAGSVVRSLPKSPDRVVTAIAGGRVTYRNLSLPTRDKKAIQNSIKFELEDDLPFSEEDSVHDFVVLGGQGPNSQIHVAATLKKNLEDLLARYQVSGLDPDVVTSEASAYRTLLNRLLTPTAQEQPVLLVQIGHEHSSLYVHHRGAPLIMRDSAWGSRDLTASIARKYGIPLDQAEKAKIANGFVLPPTARDQATMEQLEFSDAVAEAIEPLLRDIRQIHLSTKNLCQEQVGAIYLSGGTSLLPGLPAYLTEETRTPTQVLKALSSIAPSGVTYSDATDASMSLALALALSQVGPDKNLTTNFRKGIFSKSHRDMDLDRSRFRRPAIILGVASLISVVILNIQAGILEGKSKDIDTQLERQVRGFFGQLAPTQLRTYLGNPAALRTAVEKELRTQRDLARLLGPDPKSPLAVLNDLSSSIPRDLVTDLLKYQVGSSAVTPFESRDLPVTLTFTVANPQVLERLATLIGPRLSGMQRSKPEEVTAKDGTKRLKVSFTGKLAGGK